jgi:hypothetical protein
VVIIKKQPIMTSVIVMASAFSSILVLDLEGLYFILIMEKRIIKIIAMRIPMKKSWPA